MVASLPLVWAGFVLVVAWARRPRAPRRLPAGSVEQSGSGAAAGVALVALAAAMDPRLALVMVIGAWIRSVLVKRRNRLLDDADLVRTIPEVIDLLALSVASGGSLHQAVHLVGDGRLGPLAAAFGRVATDLDRGHLLADALERNLEPLGEPLRPLLRALLGADRYGTELMPTLARLAAEARATRRRRARAAAQRVPVRMLVPLVVTVLPAFVLLTVVPTLVRTFQGLQLGGP